MGKIGISFKIDVKKLDKTRFFHANSGAIYADLTLFLDTKEADQYGQHGGIQQSTSQEERDAGMQLPFVGNAKIFMKRGSEFQNDFTEKPQDYNAAPHAQEPIQQQRQAPTQPANFIPPTTQNNPQQSSGSGFNDDSIDDFPFSPCLF